ncbi:MAG: hypothetical protein Q9220_000396 [cf. Caloplaca sp. 1 TL-2023]
MDQSVIAKAMESISMFGRRASPATQDATSTQYSSVFDSVENTQPGLHSTDTAPPLQGLRQEAINGPDVSTPSGSKPNTDQPTQGGFKRQFVPSSTHFTRPASLQPSPSVGFQFQKAVLPSFNTKPTRGPAVAKETANIASGSSIGDPGSNGHDIGLSQIITSSAGTSPEPELPSPNSNVGRPLHDNAQHEPQIQSSKSSTTGNHCPLNPIDVTKHNVPQSTRSWSPSGFSDRSEAPTPSVRLSRTARTNTPVANIQNATENDSDGDSLMMEGSTLVNANPPLRDTAHECSKSSSQPSTRAEAALDQLEPALSRLPDFSMMERSASPRHSTADEVMNTREQSMEETPAHVPGERNVSSLSQAQEALLVALKIDMQREKQENAALRAQKHAKTVEIEDLEMIIAILNENWKKAEDCQATQEQEIRKFRELAPRWKDKIQSLSDLVNGLTNDHARLRDNESHFQEQQRKLHEYKESLNLKLEETIETTVAERKRFKVQLVDAQENIKRLEQANTTCTSDLSIKCTELETEKVLNASLQESVGRLNSYHDIVLAKLAQQEEILTNQISASSDLMRSNTANAVAISNKDLKESVQQCLSLLQQPHHTNMTWIDELHRIDRWIQEHGDQMAHLASSCQISMETVSDLRNQLMSDTDSRYGKILTAFEANRPLREQITELREIKATINERLTSTHTNLVECRMQVSMLRTRDKEQQQKISDLEAEAKTLRDLPYESTIQTLRLRDAELNHADMDKKMAMHQAQLNNAENELECERIRNSEIEANLAAAKFSLADLQSRVDRAVAEKDRVELQSAAEKEALQAQLTISYDEKASEVKRLERQLSVTEAALKTEKEKSKELRIDKDKNRAQHAEAQRELEDEQRISKQLRDDNIAARANLQEKQRKADMESWTISELQKEITKLVEERAEQGEELRRVRAELNNQLADEMLDEESDSTHGITSQDRRVQDPLLVGSLPSSLALQTLAPPSNESQESDILRKLSQNLCKNMRQSSKEPNDANPSSTIPRESRDTMAEASIPRTPEQPSAVSLPDSQSLLMDSSQSSIRTTQRSESRTESQSTTSRVLASNNHQPTASHTPKPGFLGSTRSSGNEVSTPHPARANSEALDEPRPKRRKLSTQDRASNGGSRRRRIDEVHKFNLGPTQASPIHVGSNLRKKVTRGSTREDKFTTYFEQKLSEK